MTEKCAPNAGKGAAERTAPPVPAAIDMIFPDLTEQQRTLALQLQQHADQIQQWFEEDPGQVELLQTKPQEALGNLSQKLGIPLPAPAASTNPNVTILLNPLECRRRPSPLITAVWQFIGQNDANLKAWSTNPAQVIRQVATTTGASNQDREALISAFERASAANGREQIFSAEARRQHFEALAPSQLMVRFPQNS